MKNKSTLPSALIFAGAFVGSGLWFILFERKIISNVTIALPLMSLLGGSIGYILTFIGQQKEPLSDAGELPLKKAQHWFLLSVSCLIALGGAVTGKTTTLLLGLFLLVIELIPLIHERKRRGVAPMLWAASAVCAVILYIGNKEFVWLLIAAACAVGSISALYNQKNADKLRQMLGRSS